MNSSDAYLVAEVPTSVNNVKEAFGSLNIFVIIWYFMIGILGIGLNVTIVFTYILMKKTKIDQYFFLVLTASDLCLCATQFIVEEVLHFTILTRNVRPQFPCSIISFIVYLCFGSGLMAIVSITVNRYLNIVHNAFFKTMLARHFNKIAIVVCSSCLIIPAGPLFAVLFMSQGNGFVFDEGSIGCDLANGYFRRYLITGFTLTILIALIACYLRIFVYFQQCQKRIGPILPSLLDRGSKDLLKTMATIVFVYFFIFGPTTISAFNYSGINNDVFRRVSICMTSLTTVTNPIIYFLFNLRSRKAVKKALRCRSFSPPM